MAPPPQDKRLQAASSIASELLQDQRRHSESLSSSTGGEEVGVALDSLPKAKQLEHALRRCSPVMVRHEGGRGRGAGDARLSRYCMKGESRGGRGCGAGGAGQGGQGGGGQGGGGKEGGAEIGRAHV